MFKLKKMITPIALALFLLTLCACGNAGIPGEVKEHEVGTGDTLSAICPKDWNEFEYGERSLFFTQADELGDYIKPYFMIQYNDTVIEAGGIGDDVSFEIDGKTWTGVYDSRYELYNIVTTTEKGSVYVASSGIKREEKLFEGVLSSIKVTHE